MSWLNLYLVTQHNKGGPWWVGQTCIYVSEYHDDGGPEQLGRLVLFTFPSSFVDSRLRFLTSAFLLRQTVVCFIAITNIFIVSITILLQYTKLWTTVWITFNLHQYQLSMWNYILVRFSKSKKVILEQQFCNFVWNLTLNSKVPETEVQRGKVPKNG